MRSVVYFLGATLTVSGCSQAEAPDAAPSAAPSAPASAALVPSASATEVSSKPFAESFIQVELKNLRTRAGKLPPGPPDLPRDAEHLRGPQYPFKTLYSSKDSLCGISYSGNFSCFSGPLSSESETGWTKAAMGDGFAIGVGGGFMLAVTKGAPVKLASSTATEGDGGVEAGAQEDTVSRSTQFRAVAAGGEKACAVEQGGAVQCWSKQAGCTLQPPDGLKATQVAVGGKCFACAASESGVRCWGSDAPVAETQGSVAELVAGKDFVCGVEAGKPTCVGRKAPEKVKRLVAAGNRLCWLDAEGAVGCDQSETGLKGKYSDLAITEKWACGADETGYWTCDGVTIPEFDYWRAHPAWSPNADRRKAVKEARKALLDEFAGRFKTLDAPVEVSAGTKLDVGPLVETKYLPLLQNVGLDWSIDSSRVYRYGAQIGGVKGGTYLLLVDEFRIVLFAFDDSAELKGHTIVAQLGPYFEQGIVQRESTAEEYVSFSLDTRGILELSGRRIKETHEFEPIQKKDVVQCVTYDAKLTLNVAGKSVPKTALGWGQTKNTIGNGKGCAGLWAGVAP